MVPNIGPVCVLFLVWVCRNDGKEDVKNVSCVDSDTEEENLTGSCSLGITSQYYVRVFELFCMNYMMSSTIRFFTKYMLYLWFQLLTQT